MPVEHLDLMFIRSAYRRLLQNLLILKHFFPPFCINVQVHLTHWLVFSVFYTIFPNGGIVVVCPSVLLSACPSMYLNPPKHGRKNHVAIRIAVEKEAFPPVLVLLVTFYNLHLY